VARRQRLMALNDRKLWPHATSVHLRAKKPRKDNSQGRIVWPK
jgi:hypothetical protein